MKIELIDDKELDSYPSASGIEYFDSHIYVIGDDAKSLLVTNRRWKKPFEIPLFTALTERVSKNEKADLEASAFVELEGRPHLLLIGSGARPERNTMIVLDIETNQTSERDLSAFYKRVKEAGVEFLNIEGAAQVNEHLLLCNRGHRSNPGNEFIRTSLDFFRNPTAAPIEIIKIKRPPMKGAVGVSGLCYSTRHDALLFTTSSEDKNDASDDRTIGNSYLGIIENAEWKIGKGKMRINELIDLASVNKKFEGYKVESVCIQSAKKGSIKIHMVADNDNGTSHLFKALLSFR